MNLPDPKPSPSQKPFRAYRPSDRTMDPKLAAAYISDMALELRNMAKANGLVTLQGLLEVAYYEAFGMATQHAMPEGEMDRLKELSRASDN